MSAEPESRILVHREGPLGWVVLNRPDRLNALVGDMRQRLAAALRELGADEGVRVIVVTGAGRAFSAGADVSVMGELLERDDIDAFAALVDAGSEVVRAVREAPKPVIAAVNGVAVGAGASLALACDLRLASRDASIGLTFNRIGLHPDWGATHFLPRLVGHGRTAELILSARIVKAEEAWEIGLFEQLFPAEAHLDRVTEVARALAEKSPLALALAKRNLDDREALERALDRERDAQLQCFRSDAVREGVRRFLAQKS